MVGMADMSSVSKENIEVMDALIGNFALYDDVNKVYDILKGHRKLSLLCEERQTAAKTAIKQLQKKVTDLEERKNELVSQNEEEMRQENEKLKEELSQMNAETKSLEGSLKELEAERDGLNRTLVEREENHQNQNRTNTENEHRIKHELSLFAHISKINWTSTNKDASKIQGVISKTNKGDLNTFCFDTRKMSKYQMANKLWEAMDE
jgi:kinetochore protein Spc24